MNGLARNPKQIGNLTRRARTKSPLSQKALGEKAGLVIQTTSVPIFRIVRLIACLLRLVCQTTLGQKRCHNP